MPFPPSFLDDLRTRISLSEVIGRTVTLTRNGNEYKGLCPFHNEKTPSFTVVEDKGFYHCFGCGAHGDAIGFIMQTANLSFPEAVESLAAEAGLAVPKPTPEAAEQARREADLHDVLELAARFFESQLRLPEGQTARRYFENRGLTSETIDRFRLGYAPAGNALKTALGREGVREEQLVAAGLARRAEGEERIYDYFRDRVMFPISDRRGRVIAFGGRVLDDRQPKYLNSPDTPVFHKGQVLYGLAQARQPARDTGRILVCEGYMDVIALSQAGFAHAVAPLGTALTEQQIRELWRLAPEPALMFDGDAAGRRAAHKAALRIAPILEPGKSAQIVMLPEGQDPDDVLRSGGRQAMAACLDSALGLADLFFTMTAAAHRTDTPERRAGFQAALNTLADSIGHATVRGEYRQYFRDRFFREMRGGLRREPQSGSARILPMRRPVAGQPGDTARKLLALLFLSPDQLIAQGDRLVLLDCGDRRLQDFLTALLIEAESRPLPDSAAVETFARTAGFADVIGQLAGPLSVMRFNKPDSRRLAGQIEALLDLSDLQRVEAQIRDDTILLERLTGAGADAEPDADGAADAASCWARIEALQAEHARLLGALQDRAADAESF